MNDPQIRGGKRMLRRIIKKILERKARELATTADELAIELILAIVIGKPKLPE